jgi:hypothetical protein
MRKTNKIRIQIIDLHALINVERFGSTRKAEFTGNLKNKTYICCSSQMKRNITREQAVKNFQYPVTTVYI